METEQVNPWINNKIYWIRVFFSQCNINYYHLFLCERVMELAQFFCTSARTGIQTQRGFILSGRLKAEKRNRCTFAIRTLRKQVQSGVLCSDCKWDLITKLNFAVVLVFFIWCFPINSILLIISRWQTTMKTLVNSSAEKILLLRQNFFKKFLFGIKWGSGDTSSSF